LKFKGKLFPLFLSSSFNQGWFKSWAGVYLWSGLTIILDMISIAPLETPSNSGISKVYTPFFTAYKIPGSVFP